MNESFIISEKTAAAEFGIARDRFSDLRATGAVQEGRDWCRLRNQVFYCDAGVRRAGEALGIPVSKKKPPLAGAPRPGECLAIVKWKPLPRPDLVVDRFYTNKQILGCLLDGKPVRVKVATNEKFVKGMQIPARHIEADLWQITRPCPRNKGKW